MTDSDNHLFQAIGKLQGSTESLIADLQQLRRETQDSQTRQGERVGKLEQQVNEMAQQFAAHEAKYSKNGNGGGNGKLWHNPKVQVGGAAGGGVFIGWLIEVIREALK